jgi:2-phospho-L-lactate/phosphoenolpyruvate guanylyltransferase
MGSSQSESSQPDQSHVVVVPIKRFTDAKHRLTDALSPTQREHLARSMAVHVLANLSGLRVVVVCDDPDVKAIAEHAGAETLHDVGGGLNPALTEALAVLRRQHVRRATIVHADLPQATPLAALLSRAALSAQDALLLPDRHGDGTNVLSIPLHDEFVLSYGARSFALHLAEVRGRGLRPLVVLNRAYGHDVDVPADL